VDNGDNKCSVVIKTDNKKEYFYLSDFYSPTQDDTNIMFAASGDLISVRSLLVKQIVRNSKLNSKDEDGNKSKQSCNCCLIM
jgi:hypothetical protein